MSRKSLDQMGKRRRRDVLNDILEHARATMENDGYVNDIQINENILQNEPLNPEEFQDELSGDENDVEMNGRIDMLFNCLQPLQDNQQDIHSEDEPDDSENEEWFEAEVYGQWAEEEEQEINAGFQGRNYPENNGQAEGEDFRGQPINDDEEEFRDRRPLYHGAPLTVGESMILILTILLHHNVTYLCLADIITVINMHCLQANLKKNNLLRFQKYFSLNTTEMIKHYYCSVCLRPLASVDDFCPSCPRKRNSYFAELNFLSQLQEMYKRDGFYNHLQSRLHRPRHCQPLITDIYDGSLYQEWMNNGFLSSPENISFSWYTDGIPVFKSSKTSVWPLYLTINELPFEMRKKKENTLLVGLWFGDKKPNANYFIYQFRDAFNKILRDGIEIFVPSLQHNITVRGVLLTGTCDLPAKCQFLNFVQFNGDYGCPACLCKGGNINTEHGGSVHVYPYDAAPQMRTTDECNQHANDAKPGVPQKGVKGPNAISKIMPDFMRGMGIDKMHGIEGGVVKKILSLLFDAKYRNYAFSLHKFTEVITSRLLKIKPPKFVHRMPRSVQDLLHWKASELKIWFFYYSVPVLTGLMRQDYFENYLLLVVSISLLNGDSITPMMLKVAHDMLNKFVREFEIMYGIQFCSINVHQLLHLTHCVETLGPLWTFSCFEYENLNGLFLKSVHGTGHIDTQIAKSHDQFIKMIKSIERLPEGLIKDFCLKRKRQVKLLERISSNCFSVGYYTELHFPNLRDGTILQALRNSRLLQFQSIRQYLRLLKDAQLFVAELYTRDLQTESFIVKYSENNSSKIGSVYCFLRIILRCECGLADCQCPSHHVAVIREIEVSDVFCARGDRYTYTTGHFLNECIVSNNLSVIAINKLESVCIRMIIDGKLYVGIPVNRTECE